MDAMNAVREAAASSGVPVTHIGPAMGKRPNYINVAMARGRSPQADTLAAMLKPCCYVLAALPADQVPPSALVIDPADTKPSA
jgi:hypothetical protein